MLVLVMCDVGCVMGIGISLVFSRPLGDGTPGNGYRFAVETFFLCEKQKPAASM